MVDWASRSLRLHPDLQEKCRLLEAAAVKEGITIKAESGVRGFQRQALLWSVFRRSPSEAYKRFGVVSQPAPAGWSRHHPYFDGFCAAVDISVTASASLKKEHQDKLGQLARECGLVWGGDWKKPDRVHFELAQIGGKPLDLETEYIRMGGKLDRAVGFIP